MEIENWSLLFILILITIFILVIVIILSIRNSKRIYKSAEYPTIAENNSTDPNVIEISLTASDNEVQILNGDMTKLFNYNHSFPGPLIEAKKGDILIVHFFNDISQPSTITWHGLLAESIMDGSKISQLPVEPGDSFTYKFHLINSGLFWYHSDINSREQVQKGLYGVILVHDYYENENFSLPSNEKILAFSDLKLDNKNQIDVHFETSDDKINGILGNILLTNGVNEGYISIPKDVPVRLRMVNCATDRFMKIYIDKHDMLRIGGDQGLLEKPILIKENNGLMLTTGERADIIFVPRFEKIKIFTEANPRGIQEIKMDEQGAYEMNDTIILNNKKLLLVTLNTFKEKDNSRLEIPLELKTIKRIKVDHCTPIIPVDYGYNTDGFYAFKLNDIGIPFDFLKSKEAPIVFENGTYIIEVANYSPLANNFYIHGFSFQHLDTIFIKNNSEQRIANRILENKDTIYIPPKPKGRNSKTIVRLAIEFTANRDIIAYGKEPNENRSGGWIFQSHILTNADLGQESFIQIVAECERTNYPSYANSYSSYSEGDHTFCLTKSKNNSTNSTHSTNSTNSTNSIDSISKSLIVCNCGSGLSIESCCLSNSKRFNLAKRLMGKRSK